MRTKLLITAAMLVLFAAAPVSAAPVYDALQDFSISSNPNGTWAYGEGTAGTTFTLLPNPFTGGFTGNPNFQYWQSATPTFEVPLVGKNVGATPIDFGTLMIPTNALLVHPGVADDVLVRWTAPTAGTYSYSGFFELLDINPSGVIGQVYANNVLQYSGLLTGPGANQTTNTPGQSESFSGLASLNAGDTLLFAVNNDGSVFNDSTGFNVNITAAVPEPLTLSVFGAGLAGIAAMRRRKRANA